MRGSPGVLSLLAYISLAGIIDSKLILLWRKWIVLVQLES